MGAAAVASNVEENFIGCFHVASRDPRRRRRRVPFVKEDEAPATRASIQWDAFRKIASPTTLWANRGVDPKTGRPKHDDKAALASATDLVAGSFVDKGKGSDISEGLIVVAAAVDMIPAGIQFCKDRGKLYAGFIDGGSFVYCGNKYGRLGSVPHEACMPKIAMDWTRVTQVSGNGGSNGTSVCQDNLPCGTLLSAAVYGRLGR